MAAKWGKRGKEIVGGAVKAGVGEPKRITNKLEHTLVAESKTKRGLRARQVWRRIQSHRRFKPAAVALVVLVALGVVAGFLTPDKKAPPVVEEGPKCTYASLEKIKPNLDPRNVRKLEPQVREVESISDYDQDVNCLFVVLTFYIHLGDPVKARENFDKLEKVYSPGEGFETVISEYTKTPEELKRSVEFLEKQAATYKDYNFGAPKR